MAWACWAWPSRFVAVASLEPTAEPTLTGTIIPKRAALGAALFVSAAAVALLLLPLPASGWAARAPRLFQQLENLAHPLLFALLAHLWLAAWPTSGRTSQARRIVTVLLCLALFAIAAEGLQWLAGGRDPSLQDVAGNILGAAFVACWHWPTRSAPRQYALLSLPLLAIAPLAFTLLAYAHRSWEAPVLWRPDSRLFGHFTSWNTGEYPGLSVDEPLPDWRAYRELLVRIENPNAQAVQVILRVNDRGHDNRYEDRYNEEFLLPAASTATLAVPLTSIERARREEPWTCAASTA